jgi:tRNA threonylcarbamoyladenosine biosynthesis protein TsaB
MNVLLLHTCGAEGSAALADTRLAEAIVAQAGMPGRTASERLVAVVRELLQGAGWVPRDLGAVVVVSGPGSFTGVRVGLSAAKGLCEALQLPLVGVSRLALLELQTDPEEVCAVLDAGRGEFYCGHYRGGECVAEVLLGREEMLQLAGEAGAAVGCEDRVAEAFAGSEIPFARVQEPMAAEALLVARERLVTGSFDDPMELDANYLRRTDAEIFAKA